MEVEPRFTVTAGTLRTGISGGLALHGGWNAPRSREWRDEDNAGFFLRVSFDAEGELVVRDLFLDGSTFDSSIHTERELWVGRLRSRIQIGWSRVAVEFRATHSTQEFQGQDGRHTYGTLSLLISS